MRQQDRDLKSVGLIDLKQEFRFVFIPPSGWKDRLVMVPLSVPKTLFVSCSQFHITIAGLWEGMQINASWWDRPPTSDPPFFPPLTLTEDALSSNLAQWQVSRREDIILSNVNMYPQEYAMHGCCGCVVMLSLEKPSTSLIELMPESRLSKSPRLLQALINHAKGTTTLDTKNSSTWKTTHSSTWTWSCLKIDGP